MKRKIKPYPAIVPDDVKPAEQVPSRWGDYLAIAVMAAPLVFFILLAFGIAGYLWGMVQ